MNILMICLGNICRSPLAEGIMRKLAQKSNLNWKISSAGTINWHQGKSPDYRSIAAAKSLGYDISAQRARHFCYQMFAQNDLIFVMDKNNYKDVIQLAQTEEEQNKVKLFLEKEDLVDPYYDDALFDPICRQVESRCMEIIKQYI